MFNPEELARYARHFSLPNVGLEGQNRLKNAKVLCVGAGGLGSPLLFYLCAAGVGTLGIIDNDTVDLTNLQRQILYGTRDLAKKKVEVARAKLQEINPHVTINSHDQRLTQENALEIIAQYDIIADGSDNFSTRYLVNDACFHLEKPLVYASVFQFNGQCSVFHPPQGPCYRCLFESPPESELKNCAEAGVLGPLAGLLGSLQATEVLKLILKIGVPLIGRLLTIDILNPRFQEFIIPINPECCLCKHKRPFSSLPHYNLEICPMPTQNTSKNNAISAQEFSQLVEERADFTLLDVREPDEYAAFNLNGILIPLGELSSRLNELDKKKPIIVHCRKGPRSQEAAKILSVAGFDVKYLEGGILEFQNKNTDLPIDFIKEILISKNQDRSFAEPFQFEKNEE